jgi:hypothetical protein
MGHNIQVGEAQLVVCGKLQKVGEWAMVDEKTNKETNGHSGAVAMMGRVVKFKADKALCDQLQPHVGRIVIMVGEPDARDGHLKLSQVHQVLDQSQNQIWSSAPAAAAAPARSVPFAKAA